ncbi:MAG: AMP-binding protein [Clostridiaceae bacterium]|nr:AMP-binding protein [Clostridiaceae bacterium]
MGRGPAEEYKVKEAENYYILHTSGSTGKPKGVQITRKDLESFLRNFESYCVTSEDS